MPGVTQHARAHLAAVQRAWRGPFWCSTSGDQHRIGYWSQPRENCDLSPQLTAFAFDPPLVHQRPKEEAGSDTEDSAFVDP